LLKIIFSATNFIIPSEIINKLIFKKKKKEKEKEKENDIVGDDLIKYLYEY
jgi:hypothetical protein